MRTIHMSLRGTSKPGSTARVCVCAYIASRHIYHIQSRANLNISILREQKKNKHEKEKNMLIALHSILI